MVVTDAKDTASFTAAGGEPGMLARDGGDRIYNRTKSKMTDVLENWQYFPVFVKPHPTAGWLYMPLEGFGYKQHQNSEFLNYESLLVLPPKAVLTKLAPILELSLGYPFKPNNVPELFQKTTAENKQKFCDWYKANKPPGEVDRHMDVGRPLVMCETAGAPPFRCLTYNMHDPVSAAQKRANETALYKLRHGTGQPAGDAATAAAPAASAAGDGGDAADAGDAAAGEYDAETDDGAAVADATGAGKAPAPPAAGGDEAETDDGGALAHIIIIITRGCPRLMQVRVRRHAGGKVKRPALIFTDTISKLPVALSLKRSHNRTQIHPFSARKLIFVNMAKIVALSNRLLLVLRNRHRGHIRRVVHLLKRAPLRRPTLDDIKGNR